MLRLNFFRWAVWQRRFLAGLPLALLLAVSANAATDHPILALGSAAPDFSLPGVDGKTHTFADYAASPILVVVFTCNHCPIAQMYEQRIQQLDTDYRDRGVALVAIQGNDPKALRIDELDSSDMSDTLDEMKIRVEYKKLHYTYLYDGDTQSVTRAYGPQATPHVFIFDKDRKLRYEGRIDNSYRIEMVNTQRRPQRHRRAAGQSRSSREAHRRLRLLHQVAGKIRRPHRSAFTRSSNAQSRSKWPRPTI